MTCEQHRTETDDGAGITWYRWVPDNVPPATGRVYRAVRGEVPVVLLHGFVSSAVGNWEDTGSWTRCPRPGGS